MVKGLRISATFRISIGLAFLGLSVFMASRAIGMGGKGSATVNEGRAALSEAIALHVSREIARGEVDALLPGFEMLVQRNPGLLSLGLRRDGELIVEAGNHAGNWRADESPNGQIFVPIALQDRHWGDVELRFQPASTAGFMGFVLSPSTLQAAFVISMVILLYSIYLTRMLRHLDPSRVIPDRVRAALDTFAEGLLVLDRDCRIVLANRAFAETIDGSDIDLHGKPVGDFPWCTQEGELPWVDTLSDGRARTGRMVDLQTSERNKSTYMVNASPIYADNGDLQGVLASFDDVTLNEQRKRELERTLRVLGESREKIRKQNVELKILATRDPLTGCMNRRSFFESIEKVWEECQSNNSPLATIMVDVDHFKSVNDNHGHSVGDEVLRCVGKSLVALEESGAMPCRYGGEEFCITLEGLDEESAREFAEDIRTVVEASRPAGIKVTASLGIAMATHEAEEFKEVLEQADQALYVAKRRGRNRVVCRSEVAEDELHPADTEIAERCEPKRFPKSRSGIPFHAVSALTSALSFRDATTAEHSRRVADLCVRVADSLMSVRDQYILETAALLHDIGKIGTPDSVLLKPGPLNSEERDVMSHHDFIGLEIIKTTFDNDELLENIANHYAWYGGHPLLKEMPKGEKIPLGARILAICDAYDAMVTDRVYRKGQSSEAAFEELRRCAGEQFDPKLVELFITTVRRLKPINELGVDADECMNVSKPVSLQIGVLMEGMTQALEDRDTESVRAHAEQLSAAATESRLMNIVSIANELKEMAVEDSEAEELVEIAMTLLDLCRATQREYLAVDEETRRIREEMAARQFRDASGDSN